jgi:hypothetical protein
MVFYPALTRVAPLTAIRRERILPAPGEVLVDVGARVEAMSIVARAAVPGRYRILNVAQALGVSPEAADRHIRVRPGQPVQARQVVASRRASLGMVPRVIRAPQDSVVVAVGGGRVLLEPVGEPVEVRAYLPGRVRNVLPNMGVLIETVGALVQGVWGSGGESYGVLKVLVEQPDQPLQARSIDVACHGAVLVGGSTLDREALQQALELQVRGIVIGSLDPALVEMAQQVPFPVVTTEGLGQVAMALPLFHLLCTHEGREAAISGRTQPRWGAMRPEVVIPLPAGSAPPPPPPPGAPLAVGIQVRVVRGPAVGGVGTVRHLPAHPVPLETGARVWGAVVTLEGGGEQFVPYFNLELLG